MGDLTVLPQTSLSGLNHECPPATNFCLCPRVLWVMKIAASKKPLKNTAFHYLTCDLSVSTITNVAQLAPSCYQITFIEHKKAVLSQRWPRDAHYIWVPLMSSQSRTRVKLNRIFFVRFLVTQKFPHVLLGVGGWPLGYEERRCQANCPCN